jgi:hypothetical protein
MTGLDDNKLTGRLDAFDEFLENPMQGLFGGLRWFAANNRVMTASFRQLQFLYVSRQCRLGYADSPGFQGAH